MKNKGIFIIAEAGVNHNGDIALAKRLIDVAKEAGADAVKFQTFKAEKLVVRNAPKAGYQIRNTQMEESQFEMLKKLELSFEAHLELFQYCRKNRILFMSTPFDDVCADFLQELGMEIFKISSGDLTNISLLKHVARYGKPMIVSTGMAMLEEVNSAVKAIADSGNRDTTLLQCTSQYPANPKEINLRAMQTMGDAFNLPVGFSDHTEGIEIALAAAALGAKVIEKHFTLDRNLPGPDHKASLEPFELSALVKGIRKVEAALGDGRKIPAASEMEVSLVARKSLVAAKEIPAGATIQKEWISIKRPGTGLKPELLDQVVGLKAIKNISEGEVLTWESLKK